MNILLLAFALPVATILLSIVLQKLLCSPLLVAATFLGVFLIVSFTAFDSSFLVFAILYTILAYVTAVLRRLICKIVDRCNINFESGICCNENRDIISENTISTNNQLNFLESANENSNFNKKNRNCIYNYKRR